MSANFDVVVLGSGIEGLCAAATLARERRRVLVLEASAQLGGQAARVEFHPGFFASGLVPDCSLTRRALLAPLELERFGLQWRTDEPALLVPDKSGCPLLFRRDVQAMNGELPSEERTRLANLETQCSRIAPVLAALLDEPPPAIASPRPQELLALAQKALRLRRLGKEEMFALARILPSSASDWMQDALTMEAARVALTAPALAGTVLGPRAPGTSAFVFLRQALTGREPRGGSGALVAALAELCRSLGVEIRTHARASVLHLGEGGVVAVELAGGESVPAGRVLSTLPVAATLLELVPSGALPTATERAAQSFRARGTTAVLRLALRAPPVFAGRAQTVVEWAVSAPSLLALERAADCLKYAELPREPWVEVRVPSHADPSAAPSGRAVALVQCHTVPHALRGGWTGAERATLEQRMLAAFELLAPGVGQSVVAKELLTPVDIETRYGTAGGHVYDGEIALDQLWLQRPSLALSRYATSIPGLFLGGPSAHPGGPFHGGAGILSARALLAGG